MKVIGFDHAGGPAVFEERTVPTPNPASHELLIKTIAIGLNNRERAERAGEFGPVHGFTVTGRDVVGTVEAVGTNIANFKAGDIVATHTENGYAQYVLATPDTTIHLPTGIVASTAAALITPGITAYKAVTAFAHVQAGQTVVVKGAAGGVGALVVQIAADLGAHVIGIANSRNETYVNSIGANEFFAYDHTNSVSQLTDRADVVINAAMNGAGSADDVKMIKTGGTIATVAHNTPATDKQITVNHIHPTTQPSDATALEAIMKLLNAGKLTVKIGKQLPFTPAGFTEANEILESSHDGRVVIIVNSED